MIDIAILAGVAVIVASVAFVFGCVCHLFKRGPDFTVSISCSQFCKFNLQFERTCMYIVYSTYFMIPYTVSVYSRDICSNLF